MRITGQKPSSKFEKVTEEKLEIKKEVYLTTVHPTAALNCLLFRYSSWSTLLRTFAWIFKFLQWLKWSAKKKETNTNEITRNISQDEIEKAKGEVVIMVQKGTFPQELKDLKAGLQVKEASTNIVKLKPVIMNDGVLRVGGRISRAPISPDALNPMIWPKKSSCHYDPDTLCAREKWSLWSRASIVPSSRAVLGK